MLVTLHTEYGGPSIMRTASGNTVWGCTYEGGDLYLTLLVYEHMNSASQKKKKKKKKKNQPPHPP